MCPRFRAFRDQRNAMSRYFVAGAPVVCPSTSEPGIHQLNGAVSEHARPNTALAESALRGGPSRSGCIYDLSQSSSPTSNSPPGADPSDLPHRRPTQHHRSSPRNGTVAHFANGTPALPERNIQSGAPARRRFSRPRRAGREGPGGADRERSCGGVAVAATAMLSGGRAGSAATSGR